MAAPPLAPPTLGTQQRKTLDLHAPGQPARKPTLTSKEELAERGLPPPDLTFRVLEYTDDNVEAAAPPLVPPPSGYARPRTQGPRSACAWSTHSQTHTPKEELAERGLA